MNLYGRCYFTFVAFSLFCALNACSPYRSFEKTKHPSAPDYAEEKNWAALPWRHDSGDSIPQGCSIPENQKNAEVDVFFVHPTGYLVGSYWNADLKSRRVNKRTNKMIRVQATVYNAAGKLYAPRYRQAIFKAFLNQTQGTKALDLAYSDIKVSFDYYLKHWNNGRPFIIAGHSQGARHIERLIKEYIDGKDIQKLLVAAYPIGMPVPDTLFRYVPLSDSASQINCYISWNTFKWGTQLSKGEYFTGGVSVNPLTWKRDDVYAPASLNAGGVPLTFNRIDTSICDAQNHNGILWVHETSKKGYWSIGKSYHLCDYNLFYMNIRENALLRTRNYLNVHGGK